MAVGESPAVARLRLRLALREARETKGLTQRQVAKALDWSMSKVSRIESGEVNVSRTDLQALLRLFDVVDTHLINELTEHARISRRKGWWDRPELREHLTPAMIQSVQFESDASEIRSFQPTYIPGLLQTTEYAAAIVDQWRHELSTSDRTARAETRTRRREQLLNSSNPANYRLVLDESVLLRDFAGPQVLSDQLYDLAGLARAGPIALRILPLAHASAIGVGGFEIYGAADGEDVALYRESHVADEIVFTPEEVRRHRHIFDQLWEQSLREDASIRLVEARAALTRSAVDQLRPDG